MDIVEIQDTEELYRRIHPYHIKPDGTVSSAAFKGGDSYELSVELARLTTPEETVQRGRQLGRECVGLAILMAGQARELSQEVRHDPLGPDAPGGPNPAHALIIGQKTEPIAKQLARSCRFFPMNE